MTSPTAPAIRIFRPGSFTSSEGVAVSFGAADLQAIADAYDATNDPAPLVIGHPRMEHPAWGWVGRLSVEDETLVAHAERIEPSFAETVREGRYAKVSAQFYPPSHPANPAPGNYYLKHVGFLGAAAPAVKGLGTVAFASGEADNLLTIDLTPEQEHSMDKADTAVSFAEREQALNEREDKLAAREKEIEQQAADARHADHVSFAETLVAEARLAPAGKPLLIGVLDQLGERSDVISFAEGDDLTPVAALKKLLSSAVPLVSFGEAAAGKGDGSATLASFAAPAGYGVDPDRAALFERAKAIQAGDPTLSFIEAVRKAEAA